ncbi:FxSxx-COOH system tetratricopeptide repeat protein [Streptomyces sp. NBC_00820]|uniref:FxSxx-COOH system tetratricopeptide repeat protein n=1 Tax=Streptomyces sp. NBC_00820 TaxID=2975842 RepID=UPI002ED2AEB3|nr:FxSxx-COOH system tetratricopeptide repeat protein [Streptomyces sp. NBC_00820]
MTAAEGSAAQAHIEASGPRSIAAGTIGTAITGDVVLTADALNAARDIQAAPGSGNLPPRRLCLGREDELAWVRETLADGDENADAHTAALCGLGGIGKSTVALAYAHQYRSAYTLVWWITADSPARIEQSLAGIALRLFPTWAARASDQERMHWALNWLQWHPGWLLVYDNVENPQDLAPCTGALNRGHHLATSRRAVGWPRTVSTRPLGVLSADEAADVLCAHALDGDAPTAGQRQEARALADELGFLPLALEQAGAYLHQNPTIGISAFRRRLAKKLDKAADGIDPERTIARVWTHTLSAIKGRNPLAVRVLRTLAWLAPDSIPVALLETPGNDPDEVAEALGLLRAYSMVSLSRNGDSVSMHRLVQTVLRRSTTTGADGRPEGRAEAEDALLYALPIPSGPGLPVQWHILMPHLTALAGTAPASRQKRQAVSAYLIADRHLSDQGLVARTIPLRAAVLSYREQSEGISHENTISARCALAHAHESAGDTSRAISLYKDALGACEEALGHEHPHTLMTRGNLAGAYETAGDLALATTLYEEVHDQCKRVLGENHSETLTIRNNLAYTYRVSGQAGRAVPMYEDILAEKVKLFGEDHASTLNTRNNLATAYQSAGRLDRALPLLEAVVAQSERVLGETHPVTLTFRNNVAFGYAEMGDLASALPVLETVLAQREQLLGDLHPDTLQSRNNLAIIYQTAGDVTRSVPLLETVVAQYEQVLGPANPNTLIGRSNLAGGYMLAGRLNEAIRAWEVTVSHAEQVLGPLNPDTVLFRNNLADAYRRRDGGSA